MGCTVTPCVADDHLALMRRIDALFLKYPFYGARQMVLHLRREGVRLGRRRAGRLMRLMGLQAVYRAPRTGDPRPEAPGLPLSAQGLSDRAREPCLVRRHHLHSVRCGFLYLVAVMDEALVRHDTPEIFNTDQGSQFTSFAFTGRLRAAGVRILMDGRGRCMDNIFIERLSR